MNLQEMQTIVHELAVRQGWWDCEICGGRGEVSATLTVGATALVVCGQCDGEGLCRGYGANIGRKLALIHAEVSEALEVARVGDRHICDKCQGSGKRKIGVHTSVTCSRCQGEGGTPYTRMAEELADIVIRVLDLAGGLELDLASVIEAKHAYNTTRPRKHGKKF